MGFTTTITTVLPVNSPLTQKLQKHPLPARQDTMSIPTLKKIPNVVTVVNVTPQLVLVNALLAMLGKHVEAKQLSYKYEKAIPGIAFKKLVSFFVSKDVSFF